MTGFSALLVLVATVLSLETLAFQSFQLNTVVDFRIRRQFCKSSRPIQVGPTDSFRLFQSDTSNHDDENVGLPLSAKDIDSIRRRQIVFTLLYGTSALKSSRANSFAEDNEMSLNEDEPKPASDAANLDLLNILRPPMDDREYVAYTLDNGLRVLLCSDPSSTEAAAAMDVHVGACSDPVDIAGMAHFTGT